MSVDATAPGAELTERDERALMEYLTVLEEIGAARGVDGRYLVVSESGSEYTVDVDASECDCPDAEYRSPAGGCKHVRRCELATGRRPLPAGISLDDVAGRLGEHVTGAPEAHR